MQHRLHLVGFHHLCPWPPCPRADILASIHLSDSFLAKGGQFSMSPGGQFPLSRDSCSASSSTTRPAGPPCSVFLHESGRYPTREPNGRILWFGAALAAHGRQQVWFRITAEAVGRMREKTPPRTRRPPHRRPPRLADAGPAAAARTQPLRGPDLHDRGQSSGERLDGGGRDVLPVRPRP